MKTHLIYLLCLCFGATFLLGCSSEDDGDSNNNPNDAIITVNIAEYPNSGNLITTINSSLGGELSYTITSQTVSQAAIISGNELRVGDWLAFDFETNENLFVTVNVSNQNETETLDYKIAIQNVDDIWAFLNTSRSDYESANDGDWIQITESEYNDLYNYLSETTKTGASDSQIFNNTAIENYSGNRTISNNNSSTMPLNSYLFAFKYYSWINNVSSNKVKLSLEDASGPYMDFGNTLPTHNDEYNHFVLKGSNTPTSSEGYIGMYTAGAIGVKDSNGNSYKWRNGDVENLDNTASGIVFLHQSLSTTLKQWD
ncbi:hypothetical protein [Winogradskyella sp.]|uniref:hypothetical protein n=1 Tax=Winogradskyella sp. TaxID=1883156 RepID=UPI002615FEC7|nr:hypothetical protein [Winogradskyella sp.]